MIVTRILEFDAGHRLQNHAGKCRHYHGHRYKVEVFVYADELDSVGRVVDFGVIKERVGAWLDRELDHGMILERGDPLVGMLTDQGMRLFILDCPPTAENIARLVFARAQVLLDESSEKLRVTRVIVWETPNCRAEFTGDVHRG